MATIEFTYDGGRLRWLDGEAICFDWGTSSSCLGLLVVALNLFFAVSTEKEYATQGRTLAFLEIGIFAVEVGVVEGVSWWGGR